MKTNHGIDWLRLGSTNKIYDTKYHIIIRTIIVLLLYMYTYSRAACEEVCSLFGFTSDVLARLYYIKIKIIPTVAL